MIVWHDRHCRSTDIVDDSITRLGRGVGRVTARYQSDQDVPQSRQSSLTHIWTSITHIHAYTHILPIFYYLVWFLPSLTRDTIPTSITFRLCSSTQPRRLDCVLKDHMIGRKGTHIFYTRLLWFPYVGLLSTKRWYMEMQVGRLSRHLHFIQIRAKVRFLLLIGRDTCYIQWDKYLEV